MTHTAHSGRAVDAPPAAINFRTETRPDGSTVLSLLTVTGPYAVTEHRFDLDPHLTRALLGALFRDLDGIPDPGPYPEAAALLAALDSTDPTAFGTAMDAYHAHLHRLLTNGGRA
ncbi:hypothetical protein ABZ608_10135 [Streptomyces sp. NPDC013172]|uniref:hypothetical protein n=1 Tax=Streptomyces sp. NPDC013172 TaxID=3155009 RepID=UPI0033D1444E